MQLIKDKFKEVFFSILPILIVGLALGLTLTPLAPNVMKQFICGGLFVIIGLTIFLVGVDISITPIGEYLGRGMALSNKSWIVLIGGFVLGFVIAIAEPSLVVLANQISEVTNGAIPSLLILVSVSVGVGAVVALGAYRILQDYSLRTILSVSFSIVFILMLFTSNQFISIAFDASAAVTGAIAVPFVMAIAIGISEMKKNNSEADSFGIVGLVTVGAVMAVLLVSIITRQSDISGSLEVSMAGAGNIPLEFFNEFKGQLVDVLSCVLPIALIFFTYQKLKLRANKYIIRRIIVGLVFVYIGLALYLTGINAGFMEVGAIIGYQLASRDTPTALLLVSFALGAVTILAEPAVSVLTDQIEEITAGSITAQPIIVSFTIGVGIAILLAVVRIIVPGLELWHLVVPGYIFILLLMYRIPDLFVGMAFDAGAVASGPMSATFILAFVQGVAEATEGASVLQDGFGMIALVLLVPIIAISIFGWIYSRSEE